MIMNMSSSSCSRNTDLQIASSSSSSSSTSPTANPSSSSSSSVSASVGVFQMTVDGQPQSPQPPNTTTLAVARNSSSSNGNGNGKSVDDVWKEISTTACKQELPEDHHHHHQMMTLEDFLAKAQTAQQQDDVKIPPSSLHSLPSLPSGPMIFSFDNPHPNLNVGGGVVGGTGKRRPIFEPLLLLDKAAQQRQKRMIKNRESAARSRERKQAYQTQLESLALKLEQENHTLSIAKTEQSTKRYKQLMDNIIPVTEKRRPTRRVLRKVRSMEW